MTMFRKSKLVRSCQNTFMPPNNTSKVYLYISYRFCFYFYMLYLFQKLFNSLNYVIINGACNLNINIWNITQRFVLTSKIWCTRSVFFKIRSERLRDTFTFSLMYCTNWNVKALDKNCDTKRNILQYAFL